MVALLIVTPVLVLAMLTSRTVDTELIERENRERERTAGIAAGLIDEKLAAAGDTLRLLSRRVLLSQALVDRNAAAIARHLHDLRSVSDLYASAAAFAPDGVMLARDPAEGGVGQSFAFRDYFRGALASDMPYVSEVYRSAVPPFSPLTAVAYAVRDERGILGVLQLTLAPADVLGPLEPIAQFPGRTLLITDDAGRVIASTEAERLPLSDAGLGAATLSGGPTSVRGTVYGQDSFLTATALRSTGWTIHVIDDARFVLAVQRDLAAQRGGATAATALVALLIGALLAFLYEKVLRQRDALRLTQAGLSAANSELSQAGRHKSEFLASMSHELRTPLNAILGFSQLLEEQLATALNDRQRRYLRNIHGAGAHLLALINDVLDLSKVEAGRIELRPERTTTHAAVEAVLSAARAAADERGVALDAATESATLNLDVGRLRQILYNLLSNAVKFTPAGGRVGARVWTEGQDLHAEVSDSGIGIPADRQPRVFGVFERVNEDRSDSSGTGLGLALTKQLVDLHGGSISFDSVEGSGTTFRLVIPGVVSAPVAGERVLIVEDEPRDAELALAITAGLGLRAELASTADSAIAAARRSPPVAVLLDLQLAQSRGETVLRDLRECETTHRIPIAIVSVEDDDRRSRGLGADEHFVKPIDRERVAVWLSRVATRAAVAA